MRIILKSKIYCAGNWTLKDIVYIKCSRLVSCYSSLATRLSSNRPCANMSGTLMDEALAEVGDKSWYLRQLEQAQVFRANDDCSLSIQRLMSQACRPLHEVKSTVAVLLDAQFAVPECGKASSLCKLASEGKLDEFPYEIRFLGPLPSGAKVDIIVNTLGDGFIDVLKVVYFEKPVHRNIVMKVCAGDAYVPVFRPGPWAIKKGLQKLLNQLTGHHCRWQLLQQKTAETLERSDSKSSWNPENDILSEGIKFINSQAPDCDSRNEQTYWIMASIKPESGTPIAGWPETKVRLMAQNKSRGIRGAVPMNEFPLHSLSLKEPLWERILPWVYPLLMTSAMMIFGCAGAGKTPTMIVLAMAMGRYHVRRLNLVGVQPGWRRAKSLDNFRQRMPQIQEGLFLDDPTRRKLDISDLKSFVTADEDQTTEGRYDDAKQLRNQFRGIASNEIGDDPAPSEYTETTLTHDAFMKVIKPFFEGDLEKDVMAVLKRSVIFVLCETALYLRLPSEKKSGMIHRICIQDIHSDMLADDDKPLYGQYKTGVTILGENFRRGVEREQALIDASMEKLATFRKKEDFVAHADHELQQWLMPRRVLPSSSSSSEADVPPTVPFSVQLASPTQPRRRLLSSSAFVYPTPGRRVRQKQSQPQPAEEIEQVHNPVHETEQPSQEIQQVPSPVDTTEQSQPVQETEEVRSPEDKMDVMDPDEEAAAYMHG